jgi:hypothetical protein
MGTAIRLLLAALLIPIGLSRVTALSVAVGGGFDDGNHVPRANPLRFDHPLHVVEAGMTCEECHEGVPELGIRGRSVPDHETCEGCHDLEEEDTCGTCHLNPEEPEAVPLRAGLYEGFAHRDHMGEYGACERCHGDLIMAEDTVAGEPIIPAMSDCQQCHLSRRGPLDCGACHLGLDPVPTDHDQGDWRRDHGLEAAVGTSDCASCHAQASCDVCHQGVLLDGSPPGAAWLHEHWAEASFGQDCLVCHETRRSCTECHRALVPVPHEFGPEFANDITGGAHADEARAFPETCLSCHDIESADHTCARCHDD